MRTFLALFLFLFAAGARAQLPQARLLTIYPPGAAIGGSAEVTVNGPDLDELKELRFSNPGIIATNTGGNKFSVAISTNVNEGIYEARAIGRFGASNPRLFVVDHLPQVSDASTNQNLSGAQELPLNTAVFGRATASAADYYRFKASANESVTLICHAEQIDSRLQPVLILSSANGKEVGRARTGGILKFKAPATGDYTLKLHDVQFRGGEEFWYRLAAHSGDKAVGITPTSLASATVDLPSVGIPETVENDTPARAMKIEPPCDIRGEFFPQRDVDWYEFECKTNKVFWIEVISHRLGLATDPLLVIQRVSKNEKGEEKIEDTQEVYDTDSNPGGAEFNMTTRDPMRRLEAKEGIYRIQVRDLFNHKSDSSRIYRLIVKEDAPDFALVAAPVAPPPLNRDLKEATPWGLFLRRGDTIPIRVFAYRQSGFNGDISLSVENLPAGVSSAPAFIKAGANTATLMLQSTDGAAPWTGPIRVLGDKSKTARGAAIRWHVADYNNEFVQSHLTQELVLAVGAEPTPIAIRQTNIIEAIAGAKVSIPLSVTRRGEFNQPIKFRVFTEPVKEFEIDGKATNAVFELDLNQSKLAPGQHWFPIHATSPGKYLRSDAKDAKPVDVTATFYSTFGVNVTAATAAKSN